MVTLHHFTDPLWLWEKGGWLNEDAPAYFKRYVEQVVLALRDHTTLWCTINEPNVYAAMGYVMGEFPPGRHNIKSASVVLRRMLAAHALAYKAIHSLQEGAQGGLAHNLRFFDPLLRGPEGQRLNPLQRQLNRAAAWAYDLWFNQATLKAVWDGLWLPPLGFSPAFATRRTLDWFGLNYYTRDRIAFDREAQDEGYARTLPSHDAELLAGGYGEMYPEGLTRAIRRVARMGIPIHVTENGIPGFDDEQRQRGLMLHLHQLWRVLQQNIPVMRYYHWTLVDNFEWVEGWTLPFGLIEMDPETQRRTHRPSADLYAAIARSNAITPEIVDAYTPELRPVLLP
jgi:beta-glucosidase